MGIENTAIEFPTGLATSGMMPVSEPLSGADLSVGGGFEAQSFRASEIGGAMDPLVMLDHYVMTKPTFGVHPHAGMSAVSLLFEDSEGHFHNRDSLGNDFDLQPGDLYWLSAGSGAVHDESPRRNSRIHGLQVFVNVPQSRRFETPSSLFVSAKDMPVIDGPDYRVRVALGESNGIRGAVSPSTPMAILDGKIQPGGCFSHQSAAGRGVWVLSVEGSLDVAIGNTAKRAAQGQAIAIRTDGSEEIEISNQSDEAIHFVLFDGKRIAESYVQEGPFVMGTQEQIVSIKAAYEAGRLGNITNNLLNI